MPRRRVQLFNQSRGVEIDTDATVGAVVGVNLFMGDGSLVTEDMILASGSVSPDGAVIWRTIMERPENVDALANHAGTGIYVIMPDGESETRAIEPVPGQTTVQDGNGIGGNPTVGLDDVTPAEGGAILRVAFDSKGRRVMEGGATTDDLAEGQSNLYYSEQETDARVAAGIENHKQEADPHDQYLMKPDPAPEITGSTAGNAALESLLQELENAGIIVNNTTP